MSKLSFEENLSQLEKIVEQMEKGNVTLEESLELFEKGIKLTHECQKSLDKAETKVRTLIKDEADGYQLQLLD